MSPNAWGRGERGVAGSQPMSTEGAQINFGDLTPHLTYGTRDKERSLLSLELQTPSKSFRYYTLPRVMWEVISMPRLCKSSYGERIFSNIFISICKLDWM
jgi:hypothetical protein